LAASTIRALGRKKKDWLCKRCKESTKTRQGSQSTNEDCELLENENQHVSDNENKNEGENEHDMALKRIEKKLEDMCKTNDKILRSMNSIEKQYEELKKKNIEMKKENEQLNKRLTEVEVKLEELTKTKMSEAVEMKSAVNKVQQNQNELEQYSRNKNIEIYGVDGDRKENLKDTIQRIAEGLNLHNFNYDHIDKAHRLPTRNKNRPETIVIQFKTRHYREEWLMGKKGRITNDDVFQKGNKTKIYVNEHLTPFYKMLIWKSKQQLKATYKYIWFKEGRIQLRKDDTTHQVQIIKSEEDLSKLTEKTITSNSSSQ